MHTTPDTNAELTAVRTQIELERLRLELTMIRVQTKALETLERLMDDPEPTGNEKQDRFEATKRNRQRLAANQVLIHCRTAEREKRLAKSNTNGAPPSPLGGVAGEGGDRSQIDRRMRGRPEPSENQSTDRATGGSPASAGPDQPEPRPDYTTSGCAADPSPRPSPARSMDGGEGASLPDRRMRGRPEPSENQSSDRATGGSPASAGPDQPEPRPDYTYPKPSPKRSRYKVRKPKHPRRSRKRKRGR